MSVTRRLAVKKLAKVLFLVAVLTALFTVAGCTSCLLNKGESAARNFYR